MILTKLVLNINDNMAVAVNVSFFRIDGPVCLISYKTLTWPPMQ